MRAYARKLSQDEEKWGIVGLLHDFDYERWPTAPDHPLKGSEILRERGYPEEVITSILSHADYLSDRYPRVNLMDKALYACDEITGLITANLWAKLSATDATLVAVLSDVEPSGASNQLTAGFLMASQRAIDPKLSTYTRTLSGKLMIRPWHPFTQASQKAVTPGEPTEYKIEIYPTSAVVRAGDRLRLTIGTANTFSSAPSLPVLGNELGGTITLLHGPGYDSNVLLPIAP